MPYTLQEAVNVSRAISEYLEKDLDLLKTEGTLRISGSATRARQIVDALKSGEPLVLDENYGVHDYVSALKKVIKECSLIEPYQLSELTSPDGSEEKKRASAESLDAFIKNLITHGNPEAAEIIHDYFHLAFMTASYAQENKMPVSNVAIVLAGTLAPHMLPEEQDIVKQTQEMTKICENALNMATTLHTYDRPYNQSYAKEQMPFLTKKLEAANSQIALQTEKMQELQASLKQHQQDLATAGFFTKRTIKSAIKDIESSIKAAKPLLTQIKKDHVLLARKEQMLSTSPSSDLARRASPIMLSHQVGAKRPTTTESSPLPSPPPNRPRMR